jgi:hypothetical protein
MLKKVSLSNVMFELLYIFPLLLLFLDSYQVFSIPLTWIGNGFLFLTFVLISLTKKIKLNHITLILILTSLVPTLINTYNIDVELSYLFLRIFSFTAFVYIMYVTLHLENHVDILTALNKVYLVISIFSIYTFLSQIFNFYEPYRNRPGTGILGFDVQSNFWISSSHRMVGTFREPIFLISLLFPAFLVLHYKFGVRVYFYLLSGLVFGLTKSELALLIVVLFVITDIYINKIDKRVLYFFIVFLITFFVPIKECDISPSNSECPQYTMDEKEDLNSGLESNSNKNEFSELNNISKIKSVQFDDRERSDIISFTNQFIKYGTGFGYQNTNSLYTDYLSIEVERENYLVIRTSPKYLNIQYLAKSFGTGRYFLLYEDINLQNNFLFNFFSIGPLYGILLFLIISGFLYYDFKNALKIILVLISISLASFEDLLPVFGLYLGLMFKMENYEDK